MSELNFPYTQEGFNQLQATLTERLQALERVTGITRPEQAAPEAPEYTGGNFEFEGQDLTFTQAAFFLPNYGYVLSNDVAADPAANAELLNELLERNSPLLVTATGP